MIGLVAQWIEQFRPKEKVERSSRSQVTIFVKLFQRGLNEFGLESKDASRSRVTIFVKLFQRGLNELGLESKDASRSQVTIFVDRQR